MKRICDENCNSCPIMTNSSKNIQTTYFILAKLNKKYGSKIYKIVEEICPNLTACPECRIDDFSHIEGCKLEKKI